MGRSRIAAVFLVAGIALGTDACGVDYGPCGVLGCGDGGGGGNTSPVSAVTIHPGGYRLVVGDTVRLSANASCPPTGLCPPVQYSWRSSQPAVATATGGLVTAVGHGVTHIIAEGAGYRDSSEIHVGSAYHPLSQMGAGGQCALTGNGAAYCWGGLEFSSPDSDFGLARAPRVVGGNLSFRAISSGATQACGVSISGMLYCWGSDYRGGDSPLPTLIDDARTFHSVSVGTELYFSHLCALGTDGVAYCLGANDHGQLGSDLAPFACSGSPCSDTLLPVTGAPPFTVVRAGDTHTCALTPAGVTYCWGGNFWGQRGDTAITNRSTPGPVAAAPAFIALAASHEATCGLTGDGAVFCWGRNDIGQLGLGTHDELRHPVPTRVPTGGVAFAWLDAGAFTCAGTNDGRIYCWGYGRNGIAAPTRVTGGPAFGSVGVDLSESACATGNDGRGYCWTLGGTPVPLIGPIEP